MGDSKDMDTMRIDNIQFYQVVDEKVYQFDQTCYNPPWIFDQPESYLNSIGIFRNPDDAKLFAFKTTMRLVAQFQKSLDEQLNYLKMIQDLPIVKCNKILI